MEEFMMELYESMSTNIALIHAELPQIIQRAEMSYLAAKDALEKVCNYLQRHTFADQEEEIRFFKTIKPRFLQELIYYAELYTVEAGKPPVDKKAVAHYLKKVKSNIRFYFEQNRDFHTYWLTGKTHLDHIYFVRQASLKNLPPEYAAEPDSSGFTTLYSFKLGKMMAYQKLVSTLEAAVIPPTAASLPLSEEVLPLLEWTDSKAGLVEQVYAWFAKGAINHGKATLKQIVQVIEKMFHTRLGNYTGTFSQNIRIRKKDRTHYLKELIEYLERKMDEEDENPKFS